MKKHAYSVKDLKAGYFNPPFYAHTHGEAERSFKTTVNNPQTSVHMYPSDFDLYHVGSFDDQTGTLIPATPEHIINGVAVKDVLKPQPTA